jgi:anion-transporting  ArsA/GET3 family ATPase
VDAGSLGDIVRAKAVIVCVGSGGVGKTTMSAAIALQAAALGMTVCVLTIDPARRLANAMGLASLGNVAARVERDRFEAAGIPVPPGQLWAMTLDAKRTWDDLVTRLAVDAAQARRILDNEYYQQISSALAGSQEFMAMEKLYELHQSGQFDLIVLDTPPARHALDFLDAPTKMIGFMDERVLNLFLAPGRWGLGVFQNSSAWMIGALQRITGFDVLRDISEFIRSFTGMHAGFRDRAANVQALLCASRSTFLLVTSPNPRTVDEAIDFYQKLIDRGMPLSGFILNRVHADALAEPGATEAWETMRQDPARILRGLDLPAHADLAVRVAENFERFEVLARMDTAQIARLERACPGPFARRTVPVFDRDVHDLSGLTRINHYLFRGPAPAGDVTSG